MLNNPVAINITKFILPFIMTYGSYILFHGEDTPGGGFQSGAIWGSMTILYCLVFGNAAMKKYISYMALIRYATMGVLIYAITGVTCIFMGGTFLDYNSLHTNHIWGQKIGIMSIEIGVAVTVWAAMTLFYLIFSDMVGEEND
jgi:multicomponent Na+:H+ antiporter subunit B